MQVVFSKNLQKFSFSPSYTQNQSEKKKATLDLHDRFIESTSLGTRKSHTLKSILPFTSSSSKKDRCPAVSVRDGSIFGRVKKSSTTGKSDSLSWIIQIILCWSDNTSLLQCQQLTGADVDKIFFWYDECRDYYGTL